MSEFLGVENVSFSYPGKEVLKDISLTLNTGEILCLMGPNGCGKTTLIDNIMAIHRPQAGRILLSGRPIVEYKRHMLARNIAYVPQIHDITFPYTVKEVVLMGRTAYTGIFGEPSAEDEEICMEALRKVGAEHFADKPYSRLSGGEVKMVLLARALGQRAPLIILDEPTAHLDFKNELLFLEMIVELCRKEEIAILMVTHAPAHAFYFESKGMQIKAAMMHDGVMAAYGAPGDVVTRENIARVYGVKARIDMITDEEGREMKSVILFETI